MTGKARNTDISVSIGDQPHADMVDALQGLSFGSDGLRYQRLDVRAQLQRFASPTYIHAMASGELVGSYVLDKRHLLIKQQPVTAFYRGLLSVDEHWQGQGIGRALAQAAHQWIASTSSFSPVISYGCIDKSNGRSLGLLQAEGAFVIGSLSMYMTYHQRPAPRCKLVDLHSVDPVQTSALDQTLYGRFGIRDISGSKLPGFALTDSQGVMVSARICETSFRILQMGTLAQWTTRWLVRPFASARKRFNPDHFRYVGFSQVLIRPGCESLWQRFVSTVLANHDCHFAAVYVDPQTPLFTALQKANGAGRFMHSKNGDIRLVIKTHAENGLTQATLLEEARKGVHLWPVDS